MEKSRINWLAVLVCVVLNMVIGMAWFGSFAGPWMSMIGKSEAELRGLGNGIYAYAVVTAIFCAALLGMILPRLGAKNFVSGMMWAFILVFVFGFATGTTNYAFSGRPMELGLIDHGYYLLSISLMGGIMGAWRPKAKA